ncbi:ABC-type Na+ efflux pump, permease component [Methanosarcina sp. MTP4]|uniref:ABC transporter permease n=1 Tax=Methanosarcina sp. MTP4 TaxID=1434100 RepID=UPI000616189B|nr:ABC transporter permease [Methanosarcina sp. MTP4]AKB23751.1 ABC-type Na+ efflux pump, permease component [Methanosarcina sp. MTP4]
MSKFSGKAFTVARHEFLKTVKRKEFLFMTFIFPVFLAGITLVPALLAGMTPSEDQSVGYVDMTGSFDFPGEVTNGGFAVGPFGEKSSTIEFVRYEDNPEASRALRAGDISSYIVIPEDFLEAGVIELYVSEKGVPVPRVNLAADLSDIVVTSLLQDEVDETVLRRVKDPVNIKLFDIGEGGETSEQGVADILGDLGLPFLTAFLLFFSIFSSSGYLLRGVSEEKENRVIEVLLSSATPTEILTGKVLGLGAVGLLQIVVWISAVALGASYALPLSLDPFLLFLAVVYFLFGYLLFASLMAAVGAMASSLQESQQIAGIFTFAAAAPLIFMQLLLTKPDSPLAVSLSLFPFTSPVAMLVRIGATEVPFYQVAASLFILMLSIHGVIIFSSRLFRAYLLMYGKRPAVREILRNMRGG